MAKKRKFANWCKRCKYQARNPDKCISCIVSMADALPMERPPEWSVEVKA